MARMRWVGWIAGFVVTMTSVGCCRFCERWCGTPSHHPVTCCQPCCVPVCCPPSAYGPAPANYQAPGTSWAQPRGPGGVCCP